MSETIPQTEEIPGTHISFLDRTKTSHLLFQHTEEVPGTYVSYLDKRRAPSPCTETDENDGSDVDDGYSSTPASHTHSERWQQKIHRDVETDSPVNKAESNSQTLEKTEEVPATYVTFIETKLLEAPKAPVLSNSRRITASPALMKKTIKSNKRSFAQSTETDYAIDDEANCTANQRHTQSNSLLDDLEKKFCIAVDILDPVETSALEYLNGRGQCVVVNGVYSISQGKKRNFPFPSILVTHTMPGKCNEPICIQSYQYIKAQALGARLVDAKWLVDSKHAGILLDISSYVVPSTLKTTSLDSQALLTGLKFGVISKDDRCAPIELKYNEMNLKVKELETVQVSQCIASVQIYLAFVAFKNVNAYVLFHLSDHRIN